MARSASELMGLEYEAERLVREGVSRAEVARRLGVHPMTLAGWALRGGWRRKDIEAERSAVDTRETILKIRRAGEAAAGASAMKIEHAMLMQAAIALMADRREEAAGTLERLLERLGDAGRLEGPKAEQL